MKKLLLIVISVLIAASMTACAPAAGQDAAPTEPASAASPDSETAASADQEAASDPSEDQLTIEQLVSTDDLSQTIVDFDLNNEDFSMVVEPEGNNVVYNIASSQDLSLEDLPEDFQEQMDQLLNLAIARLLKLNEDIPAIKNSSFTMQLKNGVTDEIILESKKDFPDTISATTGTTLSDTFPVAAATLLHSVLSNPDEDGVKMETHSDGNTLVIDSIIVDGASKFDFDPAMEEELQATANDMAIAYFMLYAADPELAEQVKEWTLVYNLVDGPSGEAIFSFTSDPVSFEV
jgi:hypothetical protein